jgi:hypothetical protein
MIHNNHSLNQNNKTLTIPTKNIIKIINNKNEGNNPWLVYMNKIYVITYNLISILIFMLYSKYWFKYTNIFGY